MANEATLITKTGVPLPFTCANGTGIEKGTLLTLSDPLTVAAATTSQAACAGIAAEEKIASDGKTKIAVYTEGRFRVTASGSITVGEEVTTEGSNKVTATVPANKHILGDALETCTTGETLLIRLQPHHRGAI